MRTPSLFRYVFSPSLFFTPFPHFRGISPSSRRAFFLSFPLCVESRTGFFPKRQGRACLFACFSFRRGQIFLPPPRVNAPLFFLLSSPPRQRTIPFPLHHRQLHLCLSPFPSCNQKASNGCFPPPSIALFFPSSPTVRCWPLLSSISWNFFSESEEIQDRVGLFP